MKHTGLFVYSKNVPTHGQENWARHKMKMNERKNRGGVKTLMIILVVAVYSDQPNVEWKNATICYSITVIRPLHASFSFFQYFITKSASHYPIQSSIVFGFFALQAD